MIQQSDRTVDSARRHCQQVNNVLIITPLAVHERHWLAVIARQQNVLRLKSVANRIPVGNQFTANGPAIGPIHRITIDNIDNLALVALR